MELVLGWLTTYWWAVLIAALFGGYKIVLRFFGIIIIPQDSIGIVDKKFVLFGANRTLPDGRIVALNGEAGIQADALAPGIHYFKWPWQYEIRVVKFTTVEEGRIGIVEARDGNPLIAGRVLAKRVDCDSFQNARDFLAGGGERGPQITVVPPGTYRINTALFAVDSVPVLEIDDNKVGIVTTREGRPLVSGEIAGKEVPNHSLFQDGQAFIDAGGFKGLQEQVMLAGRYYINPRFATVEIKDMLVVPIANVGVVIAYVGAAGVDLSGASFKHGNLVSKGQKGVWAEALDPGKYPVNPYTHKVELVPTANVVLNWANTKSEAHKLDERLSSITVRSSDGFPYNLDVSQIIHIPRNDAPKVIARFGSVANLVTQVLEPTIGNYFRNAAQGSDVIDFLKNRVQRQEEARAAIQAALEEYNVGAVNTLIGDIAPPEQLMKTLTDRKLAEQERITYGTQREAEEVRKSLQQATAQADTQPSVVRAERDVEIAEFNANATVKKSEGDAKSKLITADADARSKMIIADGDAKSKTINADADARVLKVTGDAEAGKTLAIGTSEADVIKLKIASMESGNYALIETAKALAASGFKLVPDIVAGGEGGQGSNLVNVLIANLIADNAKRGGK